MKRSWIGYMAAVVFFMAYILVSTLGVHDYAGWILMLFFVSLALAFREHELLKGYSYTIMIFAAVSLSMYYPQYFVKIGEFKLSRLIVPLLQLIMFGMGAALSWKDFAGIKSMTKGVLLGLFFQFTIMPFVGWSLTQLFLFPPEVAAGIILIGSCPSGLASNVMSYLARANLALSVTITTFATLMAPVMTPFYMNLLAGEFVEVDFWSMVLDIVKIIIIPVGAGLLFSSMLRGRFKALDNFMPMISMISIGLIIVVITAAGRESLLTVGPLLILATFIHNTSGYVFGYWGARLCRMHERDCRTIALEVGLQNGGLASGLALSMGKLATVGLAAAVFGPLMNITGSSLALWWRTKPPENVHEELGS
jgi:bile acid:Na+ symporter, BASS family